MSPALLKDHIAVDPTLRRLGRFPGISCRRGTQCGVLFPHRRWSNRSPSSYLRGPSSSRIVGWRYLPPVLIASQAVSAQRMIGSPILALSSRPSGNLNAMLHHPVRMWMSPSATCANCVLGQVIARKPSEPCDQRAASLGEYTILRPG